MTIIPIPSEHPHTLHTVVQSVAVFFKDLLEG
jgi:hypothetical protein